MAYERSDNDEIEIAVFNPSGGLGGTWCAGFVCLAITPTELRCTRRTTADDAG
jgi:hypothetical protein